MQDGQYLGADVNCTQLQLHKDLYNGTQPHYTEVSLLPVVVKHAHLLFLENKKTNQKRTSLLVAVAIDS